MIRLKHLLIIIILTIFFISCAGKDPVYFIKDSSRFKLYEKLENNNAIYTFKNKEKSAASTAETALFFEAHINEIDSPFIFRILLDKGDKNINVYSGNKGKISLFFEIPAGNTINGFMLEAEKENIIPALEKIDLIEKNNYFSGIKNTEEKFSKGDTVRLEKKDGFDTYIYNIPEYSSLCSEIVIDFNYHSENIGDERISLFLDGKKE